MLCAINRIRIYWLAEAKPYVAYINEHIYFMYIK